ncbi:hypothetical protein Salat_1708400 [Sesamum alatum]|uniref:Uncharacterized protein n=1 Tax=Sesamum alatum TaxID=300844 RepID=A0AAE1Y7S5_9LAMI|nr:hypothetical protein Salat_1708400 [Sesamum alatum]
MGPELQSDAPAKLPSIAVDVASNVDLGLNNQVWARRTLAKPSDRANAQGLQETMPSLETIDESRDRSVQLEKPVEPSDSASEQAERNPIRTICNMWLRHPDFLTEVARNWSYPTVVSGMARLAAKLKRLKHKLKEWNKVIFGDIFVRLKESEEAVQRAEHTYDESPKEANLVGMKGAMAEWQMAISIEEDYWKQKSSCKWVLEGDRNTRFFHSMVQKKRACTTISSITDEGRIITNPTEIATLARGPVAGAYPSARA